MSDDHHVVNVFGLRPPLLTPATGSVLYANKYFAQQTIDTEM